MTMASENNRIDSLPKMNKQIAANSTVTTVLIERVSVCHMLRLTSSTRSADVFSFANRKFSRMRSKMTTVSLTVYQMTVNTATMNGKFTCHWKSENGLMTMNASCAKPMTADRPNRHSNRTLM